MIEYVSETGAFFLDGKNVTYAMRVNQANYLTHLYYGAKIPHEDIGYTVTGGCQWIASSAPTENGYVCYQTFAPELSFFGTGDYREPCVLAENAGGDRLTDLLFDGYEILPEKPRIAGMPSLEGGETLLIRLRDRVNGFTALLYYTVYDDCDVIARHIVYQNAGKTPVKLRRAYSFTLELPDNSYEILSLYGVWVKERAVQKIPMHHGVVSVDSKRTSSSAVLNPFMGILSPDSTETSGEVWGVSLVYSSSFVLKAQGTPSGDCLILGGINDFDFSWTLAPGESLESPEAVIAFSAEGLGGMSRAFHDAWRNHLINKRYVYRPRPIVINNWEGTHFDFDFAKLQTIIEGVRGTDIDTFVLDDGWFGKRNDPMSSLGDWFANEEKLPGGIGRLSDYVHAQGLRFGLWFEPEMISEDSDLYRAHPDYAIGVPGRAHCRGRNQCVLDLTRREVRDAVAEVINRIIRENHIDYVKWDSNRSVTESVSLSLPPEKQTEFAHRYALGLYEFCEQIVNANPDVFFEGCSAGGGRFDPAMLYYFPQIWTSDNTDAQDRTYIQYGTSMVYPPSAMSCHVTAVPQRHTGRTSAMRTRGDIAGFGATGYELDASLFTDEDRRAVKEQIDEYRQWNEDLVLTGDLYRIENPFESNFMAQALVSKDKNKAILLCYRRLGSVNNEIHRVRMAGLDPEKRYAVPELNRTFFGKTLMNVGLVPAYPAGDFQTVKYHFRAVE